MPASSSAPSSSPALGPSVGGAHTDHFRRSLSLLDLTMIGFGSIFGSGWLFAASNVSAIAGPASVISWGIGGLAVLLLGLVFCELGAALPHAGGVVRYPAYSHGPLLGFLMGLITVIAFSSLISIEIVAARQYAGAWIPGLTRNAAGDPTWAGWVVQLAVLAGLLRLNLSPIRTFALFNNIVTVFKFCVPLLVIVVLLGHMDSGAFTRHGFAPTGGAGIEAAISTGGIIFAYLGLTPIIAVASEVRNPQRTIPLALTASVLMATAVYVLLQVAFVGSVPDRLLAGGWAGIAHILALPFHDIAMTVGAVWLATLVVADAIVSPAGTGNIYMSASPRIIYGWARGGTFPALFARVDRGSGVPRPALYLTFVMAVFWTLPFPSWQALIGVVSSALMMSYAFAPIAAAALRRTAPDLHRPFRLSRMAVMGPLSFIIASLIVYWSGWQTVSWLLTLQLVLGIGFLVWWGIARRPGHRGQVRHTGWVLVYFAGMVVLSGVGSFGGSGILPHPLDDAAVALFALAIYLWAERSGSPAFMEQIGR
ncbi:APC family permease [Gluconacetobacter azotocaptans]|uniref:APC family permease n=1 Tax=Gluconacetobacter azotocaptans TaxID=142834 RepID=A0A7W4JVW1_9PROT|nr:APC family permease [Gluconacetobacter azotocaptans]MBB2191844.1 APC family permease [Gluconacetobacter azotocaptans]MBM9403478.1 APC family permease [Gluconacetobacter azotocaptans]GBQ33291.1 amino acid transporter [Gluconacetobacter azotocaptans DSM 13594]